MKLEVNCQPECGIRSIKTVSKEMEVVTIYLE